MHCKVYADQALASLRIETNWYSGYFLYLQIRLSRACGLKHSSPFGYQLSKHDQALASLRIETEKNVRMCGRRRDQALASLRFEVSVLKFTQSRPDVGVNFPKI